jgi:hypothetical protein
MTATQFTEAVDFIMEEINKRFPIVHVLRAGYPLCGFRLDRPEGWPTEHRWVSCLDVEVSQKATCDDCREVMKAEQS